MKTETLTVNELADLITTTVHPSRLELGPVANGIRRTRSGAVEWAEGTYTRLVLPAGSTGFGHRWIDYESAAEARSAAETARGLVLAAPTPEAAIEALNLFCKQQ